MSVPFFILAALGFGFVIFIHELGHFLFAKWAGVRVEVFSIGFGPKLLTKRIGETDYCLSLLPLGGYVKMVGQEDVPADPNDPATVAATRDPRSFINASPMWKALILLGGVLFNLISSYLILLGLAAYGLPVLRPVVGEVQIDIATADGGRKPSPAAELGLRPGDRVLSLNGEKVRGFEDLMNGAIIVGRQPVQMAVQRPGVAEPLFLPADGTVTAAYDYDLGRPVLGIGEPLSTRILPLPERFPAGPWKAGQRVLAVAGEELPADATGQGVLTRLHQHFGKPVTLTLAGDDGTPAEATAVWAGQDGGISSTIGLPVEVAKVTPGMPAAEAGIRAGDILLTLDGTPISSTEHFLALVRTALDRASECTVTFQRPGAAPATALLTGREVAGWRRVGIAPLPQLRGRLAALAPAIDGKPSALAAAGVRDGDTLLGFVAAEGGDQRLAYTATVVRGGTRLTIPLSTAGVALAGQDRDAGRLGALFGDQGDPSLASRLTAVRVVSGSDPDGRPTGSPAGGLLQVRTAAGGNRSIDLRPLVADGQTLLRELQPGDWLLGIGHGADGKPAWEVVRGATAEPQTLPVAARQPGQPLGFALEMTPYRLEGPGEAFAIANQAAHTMIWRSLTFIPKFFTPAEQGGLDAKKSLQGPIGIFDALRSQAQYFGLASFLKLVALIGLNLVLVNLLPIPITDGGQLLFLAIETAIGRPLPPMVRLVAMYIGLAMVVAMMLFVTTLDIHRRL